MHCADIEVVVHGLARDAIKFPPFGPFPVMITEY